MAVSTLGPPQSPVVVVGGGIGGLALAHGLATAGLEVTVLERSPAEAPAGGSGLTLWSRAVASADRMGWGADLRQLGSPLKAASFANAAGKVLKTVLTGEAQSTLLEE